MKVPHNVVGRTRPTSQGMDPLRVRVDEDAFGAGLARGLDNLGAGLQVKAQQTAQRTEKLDRFQSMSNYSDFELKVNSQLAELKKTADPTGKGFTEAANKMYDIAADEFITKMVPEDMRMEARYWTSNTRQRIIGDSMNFQYEAGNAYFRSGVDKQYQRSLSNLDPKLNGDPKRFVEERDAVFATIDATDLSEIEKTELKRNAAIGLESVVYRQAVKVEMATGGGGAAGFIKSAEGFRTTPYWDVNAWRIGFGSDTITQADGTVVAVRPGMVINKDDANRDLDRRINTEFVPGIIQKVGEREWGAMSGAARAALTSVAYNYGSLPNSVANAVKSGDKEAIAASIEGLRNHNAGVNASRRSKEANLVRTGGDFGGSDQVDSNALFSNIPYDKKLALRQDAENEYNADLKAETEANTARIAAMQNALFNGLNDGTMGVSDIENARDEGILTDYNDIAKAQGIYEKRNEGVLLAQGAWDKLERGSTFDPMSEDDKKGLNALVGTTGLTALDNMDHAYLINGLVPVVTKAGDIPTDVVGLLTGMVRSNNQSKALFAYDALAMMQDADPRAFDARVSDALAADVNFYRQRRTALPADELFGAVNGGATQAERQGRAILRQEAQDILKTKEGGVAQVSTLVSSVVSGYDGWTASARQIGVPAFQKQLEFDYSAAFVDAYQRDPNVDRANEAATKQIQRDWAVSPAGGGILMKNPPEKAGYKQVMGSFDWIEKQARKELGLKPGERYELVSDDRTASEVAAAKLGGMPPSYQVVTYDESGVPRLRTIEGRDGPVPARINFSMTPDLYQLEELDLDMKLIQQEIDEIDTELGGYLRTRTPPPAVLTRQREQLQQQLDGVTRGMQELAPPEVEPELPDNQKPWSGLGNIGATPGAM